MVTAPVAAPKILGAAPASPPKVAKTLVDMSEPDPAGTTLRSAKEDVMEPLPEGSLRSRPTPEIRIEDPPPRTDGRLFWILAIVAALICILAGIWIGSR